jgi:hypothetical protein
MMIFYLIIVFRLYIRAEKVLEKLKAIKNI